MTNRLRFLSSSGSSRTYVEDNPHDPMNPIIHERNDVTEQLEQAKTVRNHLPPDKEWRAVATVPDFIMNKALREGWGQDDWRKWANNADNAYFRLWRGRV